MEEKYSCDACDFLSTQKESLGKYKQSVHEGKKYPCDTCDFLTTQKGNLRTHNKSVHEGKK